MCFFILFTQFLCVCFCFCLFFIVFFFLLTHLYICVLQFVFGALFSCMFVLHMFYSYWRFSISSMLYLSFYIDRSLIFNFFNFRVEITTTHSKEQLNITRLLKLDHVSSILATFFSWHNSYSDPCTEKYCCIPTSECFLHWKTRKNNRENWKCIHTGQEKR